MIQRRSPRRHLWLPAVAAVSLSWLALPATAEETCSPSGTALSITAFDQKFDKKCLAAPATQAFTVEFNNLDRGIPHNLSIYEDKTVAKTLFKGELVNGPGKATYSVPGLPAGTFFFRCDPHPEMQGTFISG
jgi:plastocyanin